MDRFFLVLCCACLAGQAVSFSFFRDRIPNGYNVDHPCKTNTKWDGVGHLNQQGGGSRNAFGLAFYANGKQWNRTLCMKDSDGDGQTNGQELGDPDCVWTPGSTPKRTTGITHPGFKTPARNYVYSASDTTTLDCSGEITCQGLDAPDVKTLDLRMANGTAVPARTTTYYCTTFEVPFDQIYHAVSFEPILDNLNVIHHMLVYGCEYDDQKDVGAPGECDMSSGKCRDLLAAWSLGLAGQCSPPEAGVRFGNGTYRFFQIQVHWNNPEHKTTYTDTSGVKMHYTHKLRQYDLGMLWLGQFNLQIPAMTASTLATSECTTACAETLFSQGDINVVRTLIHMHLLGKSGRIEKTDSQNKTVVMLNETVYDYDTPKWSEHNPPVRVGPTDILKTYCEYDSSTKSMATSYGDATNDEMCFGFLQYYPKRGDLRCTQSGSYDLCYRRSIVCGPECDFSYYLDKAEDALTRAKVECDKIQSTGVCTQQCADDLAVLDAVTDNKCLRVRHRTAYTSYNNQLHGHTAKLDQARSFCETNNVVGALPTRPLPNNSTANVESGRSCPAYNGVRNQSSTNSPSIGGTSTVAGTVGGTGSSAYSPVVHSSIWLAFLAAILVLH